MIIHDKLKSLFAKLNNPLVSKLLSTEGAPITALALEGNGAVSYLPIKKAEVDDVWSAVGRQSAKLATVVKKIIPETDENEVRDLVEQFKAFTTAKEYELEIVDGEDIVKIYNIKKDNLSVKATLGTRLRRACFQGTQSAKTLDMFIKNVHVIKMIVCWYQGKLDGRSLILYGKNKETKELVPIMDNIYSGSQESLTLMIDKAKELGALYIKDNYYYHPNDRPVNRNLKIQVDLRPSEGKLQYLDHLVWDGNNLFKDFRYGY